MRFAVDLNRCNTGYRFLFADSERELFYRFYIRGLSLFAANGICFAFISIPNTRPPSFSFIYLLLSPERNGVKNKDERAAPRNKILENVLLSAVERGKQIFNGELRETWKRPLHRKFRRERRAFFSAAEDSSVECSCIKYCSSPYYNLCNTCSVEIRD